MITLKRADQNFTGVSQLLNNLKKILFLFFITNSYAQVSDYEEYLRFLPDSVRSSVESRIKTDVEDDSDYDELNQLRENLSWKWKRNLLSMMNLITLSFFFWI